MSDPKKGLARIELPARPAARLSTADEPGSDSKVETDPEQEVTSHILMSRLPAQVRDPWIVPLAGLVLAFSVISLIVEVLIAFS
jgi:hypothetical protein